MKVKEENHFSEGTIVICCLRVREKNITKQLPFTASRRQTADAATATAIVVKVLYVQLTLTLLAL